MQRSLDILHRRAFTEAIQFCVDLFCAETQALTTIQDQRFLAVFDFQRLPRL